MRKRGNNEGSIFRMDNGKYRAMVTLNGRRLTKVFATKQECKDWVRQMLDQIDKGLTFQGTNTPLGVYLQEWLAAQHHRLRPKTVLQYEQLSKANILPALGSIKLKDLRPEHIDRFYKACRKAGRGVRTLQVIHAILRRVLNQAVKMGMIGRNPIEGVTAPKPPHVEMRIWEDVDITRFLIAAQGDRYAALFHLAIKTGMRQGELLGLKWTDLDWTRGNLRVQRQLQRITNQGIQFNSPKTRTGTRTISLGENILQVLREHLQRQEQEKAFLGSSWKDHGLIFPSTTGTPLDPRNCLRIFARLMEAAGVPHIRFHDLRHTAASVMLNHGIPVIVVSRILGHAKPSITLDIYGHLINDMQGEAARIMDEAITPIPVKLETLNPLEGVPVNPDDDELADAL